MIVIDNLSLSEQKNNRDCIINDHISEDIEISTALWRAISRLMRSLNHIYKCNIPDIDHPSPINAINLKQFTYIWDVSMIKQIVLNLVLYVNSSLLTEKRKKDICINSENYLKLALIPIYLFCFISSLLTTPIWWFTMVFMFSQ